MVHQIGMGYGIWESLAHLAGNWLGGHKKVWVMGVDGLSQVWIKTEATVPINPIFSNNQPCHDLLALCTSNPNPFSSLSHWNCCSKLPLENCDISGPCPPSWPCWAPPFFPVSQTIHCQGFIQFLNPTALPLPSTTLMIPMALGWESDPHSV